MEQVPKELIHMALDDIILKNQFPDVIKDLEKIAKARKISIYIL